MTTTLKDLDLHNCFKLEESLTARLTVQLEADTGFLTGAGLMDYSLLLGVHYRGLQGQQIMGQGPDGNFNRHSPDAGALQMVPMHPFCLLAWKPGPGRGDAVYGPGGNFYRHLPYAGPVTITCDTIRSCDFGTVCTASVSRRTCQRSTWGCWAEQHITAFMPDKPITTATVPAAAEL
jgi:hypothetical protein